MKKIFATIILLIATVFAIAQRSQEEQLGIQYFQNGEYEKAVQMFAKVYNANPNSYIYYYYYQTLLQTGNFKEAERVVKKQQKASPKTQRYKIDLGFVYESAGDQQAADKVYTDAIKELPAQQNTIRELYNAFLVRKQLQYAIATLEKGRKLLNDNTLFVNELTNAYIQLNRNDMVVEEALNIVKDGDQRKIPETQKILQNLLASDDDSKKFLLVKSQLLKRMQEAPDNLAYVIVMQWVYQHNKDYANALVLAKSLDRKQKEDGSRVFSLAKEAGNNKDFETAINALNYLIDRGESCDYYTKAQFLLMDVKYEQLASTSPIDKAAAKSLETEFDRLLKEYGYHEGTSEWVRKYAHLLAFYTDQPEKAKTVLNEAITNANRDPQEVGQYKIDLADIELYMGDVWEATLHYSQVEKDLPNDIIGQTAKFNNAKLSFYIGEFEWAKSQLDVLRAATSKLIANDAMYFSLLISDNEAEEEEFDEGDEEEEDIPALFRSSTTDNLPLRYYAKADFLIFQNKDDEAIKMLDSVLVADPYGKLADDVYFQKAKIAIKQKDYLGAENLLQEILKSYPTELLGDDAAYLMAQLYDYYLKDSNKAMEYYQKVLKDYSDSLFTTDARKRYRELRGDYTN
ncbi:MAG: tetratricopeptide repeat protein [Bacteroidales bacterium]|nr:tetratricopeptide repeat protein [Bacteroidales bacterium]